MGMNDIVRAVFEGYKNVKQTNYYENQFETINKTWDCWIGTASHKLLEVDELTDLFHHAKTKDHYNAILDHMYRHDATRVGYYKDIENSIIHRLWEE